MGLESANYKYISKRVNQNDLVKFLMDNFGAILIGTSSSGFINLELGSNGWLVEFQIFPQKLDSSLELSLRIALCNPNAVVDEIIKILSSVIREFGGLILDENSKRTFSVIDSNEEFYLRDAFQKKKSSFQNWYGFFTAAIRGDQVFEYARTLKKNKQS